MGVVDVILPGPRTGELSSPLTDELLVGGDPARSAALRGLRIGEGERFPIGLAPLDDMLLSPASSLLISECSALTTSAKLIKLSRRGSCRSTAPKDAYSSPPS